MYPGSNSISSIYYIILHTTVNPMILGFTMDEKFEGLEGECTILHKDTSREQLNTTPKLLELEDTGTLM